jgi:ankyrin repeat protein
MDRLAARERAQAGVRPGSAFELFLLSFDQGIGYKRKEAGGKGEKGERENGDDDDDGEPVPPHKTVEAACWPLKTNGALFGAINKEDAPALRRILRFLTRVYEGQEDAREKILGQHDIFTPLALAAGRRRPDLVRAFASGLSPGRYLDEPNADDDGLTPLAMAAVCTGSYNGQDEGELARRVSATVDALVELGCGLNAPLGANHPSAPVGTVLHAACHPADDEDESGGSKEVSLDAGLRGLLWQRAPDGAAAWVLRPGFDLDARDDAGYTPMMQAICIRRCNAASMLLQAGANARALLNESATPVSVEGYSAADLMIGVLGELHEERASDEATTSKWGRLFAALVRAGAPVNFDCLFPEDLLPVLFPALRATDPVVRELARRRSARLRTLGQEDVAGLAMDALELREAAAAEEAARARLRALEEMWEMTATSGEEEAEEEDEKEDDSEEGG